MSRANETGDFEPWLDRELSRAIVAELGADVRPPRRASVSPGRRRFAGLGLGGAAAIFAVALGAVCGGAVLATGSPNPVSWSHQVVRAVSMGSPGQERTPGPSPDGPPASAAGPNAPALHGQRAADTAGDDQPQADTGKWKQRGRAASNPASTPTPTPRPHAHSSSAAQGQTRTQ